jgi:hypothetical protein
VRRHFHVADLAWISPRVSFDSCKKGWIENLDPALEVLLTLELSADVLEREPRCDLNDARVGRSGYLPEEATRNACARAVEFRVVEKIERLSSEFQLDPLPKNRRCLGDRKVKVRAPRSP